MQKLKIIIFSWDGILAVALVVVLYVILPVSLPLEFVRDAYLAAISVLSIIFSVYFAALAVIIASTDDGFVCFLQSGGHYEKLMFSFEWTQLSLFGALIYAIWMYLFASSSIISGEVTQSNHFFLVFIGLFAYSLLAAFGATRDALVYARTRALYLAVKTKSKASLNGSSTGGSPGAGKC
jgi:hypothetical protein